MGRKKLLIDWPKVEKYLQAGCEGAPIARIIGMHPNTLYRAIQEKFKCDFGEFAQQKRAEGVSLMEASIFNDAITKGGIDRIFWLKNKAGWKDRQDITSGDKEIHPITINVLKPEQSEKYKQFTAKIAQLN